MSDFDELKRWAMDSQMTLGDVERIASVRKLAIDTFGNVKPVAPSVLDPAFFFKACASLIEAADRFAMMFGYEEIALYELLQHLRDESLPTIWRCFDTQTVQGEVLILPGHPFWTRRDVNALRAMIENLTGLGATSDGRHLKICGVFTDRQRLDAMCPLPTKEAEDQGSIQYGMIRLALEKAIPGAGGNYEKPWIGDKSLVNKARSRWEAVCKEHGRIDLLGYLDGESAARFKVRRAIGR